MLWKAALSCALLLTALEPLLTHPITQLTGMSYTGPVSEEEQVMNPDEMSYSEGTFLSQGSAGIGFPSFLTGDKSREALKTAGFIPGQVVKEVLLEKPWLNPLNRFLGGRKQYRKRGGNSECFWKYCV
ncbi:prepro-urotensin II-beta [Silurus meridionalis]|uniref:prepro-urotensin II-beta n=1 Tax=Silurus meridionalis TaxID=175797 RepID=UPI001EEC1EA5|nr:prepro-urotensin II-beta [Silurus meridionalis]